MGWPIIVAELGVSLALWGINKYLLDDEKKLPKPKPEGLEFANNTIGNPVPFVAGTVRVDNSVLMWHGNHHATPYGSSKFKYGVDMMLELGVPMWDEASAPWSNWRVATPPRIPRFWWGDKEKKLKEDPAKIEHVLVHSLEGEALIPLEGDGEFYARMVFFDGRADQALTGRARDALLIAGTADHLIPGYRHKMVLGVFCGEAFVPGALGYNPRVPAIGVEVSSLGPQPIGLDANPAWVLYDLLARPVWGLGVDPAQIDLASFQAAADRLVAEGHGCSITIQSIEEAPKIFAAILSQIDGDMFVDPATELIRLRLIRADDHDPDTIPVLTADIINGRAKIDTLDKGSAPTEISVNYTSRARSYKPDAVPVPRLGSIAPRPNQRRVQDFDAPGCMNAELAGKIGAREMAVVGASLTTIRCKVNRTFYATVRGDAIKVNLPDDDIVNVVFRVVDIDYGQLADGAISMTLIRDVFGVSAGAAPPAEPPTTAITVLPLTTRKVTEAPWHLAYLLFQNGAPIDLAKQHLLAAAVAEGDLGNRFRGRSRSGGLTGIIQSSSEASEHGISFFPTTARVETLYPVTAGPYDTTVGLRVSNVSGELAATFASLVATVSQIANDGANLALVGDEIIAFESVTSLGAGVYRLNNVWRELLDTAAAEHAVGDRLYLLDTRAVGHRAWPVGFAARVFAIPSYKNVVGSDGENASDDIAEIRGRASLSLPAADVRVSGYDLEGTRGLPAVVATAPYLGAFKTVSRLDGAFDIAGRERKREVGVVVRGDADGYTAEPGTTWDVLAQKLGDEGGDEVELRGHTGLSSPSSSGILLGQAGHGTLRVKLRTQNGGRASCIRRVEPRMSRPAASPLDVTKLLSSQATVIAASVVFLTPIIQAVAPVGRTSTATPSMGFSVRTVSRRTRGGGAMSV